MTDLALFWDGEAAAADLALVSGDLATEEGLRTAVIVSLFTDRRARPDDRLPQEGADRRGWWGDVAAAEADDEIGSRLWLLQREKQTPETVTRAREYALEALGWMLRDRVAAAVEVEAEITRPGMLGLRVTVTRPDGPGRQRFDFVWKALT
jgi:phage gp46-like protein